MKIFKAISAAALLFLALMVFAPGRVDAAVQDLNGWAWSSNIGWISFNCLTGGTCATSDYKVRLDDQTGVVSGYAWSSNVGWISFNPADISGCAPNATQPNINTQTGFAVGWARVLVPKTTSDPYWNGCIALSGKEFTSPDVSGNRGVTYDVTDKKIKGHAWGSNVIGWIKFLDVICAGCTNLPPASTDFTVQANSATLSNVPGSTVSTPVSVTRLGLNDVGVSNVTLSGLPANVTASWTRNGTAVAGNRTCTSTLPGTPSPCTFSLTLTSGATAPAVGTYSVTATAVSTSDPAFSRSETFTLTIIDNPGATRDYSVSVGDVTMPQTAGTKASTQVILTRVGSTDIGIANVTIDSGLPTGINVVPRWYQNGTQVDPRACASTSVGACQFFLEFTAEPGDATVGTYTLQLKSTSTGAPVVTKYTSMRLTITKVDNPISLDFTVQANNATLSSVPGSTVATPVSVTRLGLNDVGVANITLSGLPANVTASWTKNGAAVAGNRSCVTTLPTAPGPCEFSLTLASNALGSIPGTYTVTATAVSTTTPSFTRSEDFVLVIKGVPTPGERDYSVSVGDVTMVRTAGTKASTQVILTRTGSVDIGIANVTIESGLPTGINVVPRWYRNGTQIDPRACASTAVGSCQFVLEFTAEPGDATVGTYTLQLKSTSTGSPVIIKYTEMSLTIQPGPCCGQAYDFGVNTTDQISMDKAAGSIISTVVTATRIGTNDVGVSNLVVTGLPQNVTASWRYLDGSQVTGQRSCISTVPNACRFVLRLTATSAIAPGVSGTFPSTFPLVITGTSATTPSFNRTKNVSLVVTDPSVNPTTPTVTLKVNDKFTVSSPNNVVVIGSKNNKVQWDKGGVGSFDKCVISSNPTNPLWTGQEFDSSYDSYVQTGVTISQRTTFSVTCLQGNNPYASSVTVDVTASPDFREF